MRLLFYALGLLLVVVFPSHAKQLFFPHSTEEAPAPAGWIEFCKDPAHADVCEVRLSTGEARITLTEDKLKFLQSLNVIINADVRLISDEEHFGVKERWSYPSDGWGDCEDVDLMKLKVLLWLGWPREALREAIAWRTDSEGNEGGHGVLVIRTDRGDYVLDCLDKEVRLWSEKEELDFVKWQIPGGDPNKWIYIDKAIEQVKNKQTTN
jgi:predicted transglutaminase-like cysteine proteinase